VNYTKVIKAVFNPDPKMPCTELHKGLGTEVYRIDTPAPLVVRFAHSDEDHFKFQAELMEAIAANDEITPRILYWEMNKTTKPLNGIQVQNYLDGVQLDHYPSYEESKAIVKSVYTIHRRLCDVSAELRPDTCSAFYDILNQSSSHSWSYTWPASATVDDVIKSYFSKIDDCSIKAAANNLLQYERYNELFLSEQQYLVHFDLWPKNLLIQKDGEATHVRIVDFDTIFGPKSLQPAILFSSCFLISSLMFKSEYLFLSELEKVIDYWPESLDRQDLYLMMQIFPIVLGLKAEFTYGRFPEYTQEQHNSNIRLLTGWLDTIRKWL
jgi:hypothetical protein